MRNAPSKSISHLCVLLEWVGNTALCLEMAFTLIFLGKQKASLTASVFRIGRNLDVKHIGRIIKNELTSTDASHFLRNVHLKTFSIHSGGTTQCVTWSIHDG